MRVQTSALLLSLALGISSAGCIALARESYTSLRGSGAVEVEPGEIFEVSPGRMGHSISHSPAMARASLGPNANVTSAVCDWDAGVWFIVFPPLPIPLLSLGDSAGRPGTTVVRLTLEGDGTWRTNLTSLVLVGTDGVRAVPESYRLVTTRLDTSLEPCSADVELRSTVESAEVAIFGKAELWLRFPTLDWPEAPRALELGGLELAGTPLSTVHLDFEPGSRWFWYRVFP